MSFYLEPKVTLGNYCSYMVSGWNRTFADWGYPELDVVVQESGEWGIISYLRSPVLPAHTPWSWVVVPSAKYELNPWTVKRYVEQCDIEKRYVWDQMEEREKHDAAEMRREELHMTDMQRRMYQSITQNPDLMNRIAKNGLGEIGLRALSRNIPNQKFRKANRRGNNAALLHSTVPASQDLSAGVEPPSVSKSGTDL